MRFEDKLPRFPTTFALPKVGSPLAPRRLRLRADERLGKRFEFGEGNEPALLRIHSRENVAVGERVRVEISFGALADEAVLDGEIASVRPGEPGHPAEVTVRFALNQAASVDYVHAVIEGRRSPSARAHRRISTSLTTRWRWGDMLQDGQIRDLSRGGAFVTSALLPSVSARIDVEVFAGAASPLRFDAVVAWVRHTGNLRGFGIRFKLPDRTAAQRLTDIVRQQETEHDAWLVP